MFEKNEDEEKRIQEGIAHSIVDQIKMRKELSSQDVSTLERIARMHENLREEIYGILASKGIKPKRYGDEPEIKEHAEPIESLIENENLIKSGLNNKSSYFYQTPEKEQIERISNMIENIKKSESEAPKKGMIRLLEEISKNSEHKSVKKTIMEGLNKIAMENVELESGERAAQAYEELVEKEKNGKKLRKLSELYREVMKHPKEISPLTKLMEKETLGKINDIGKIGLKEEFRENATEYLENIIGKHSNYLINRWANEELFKIMRRK
jgi:hypothetical protein